jgi:hypothetical protein
VEGPGFIKPGREMRPERSHRHSAGLQIAPARKVGEKCRTGQRRDPLVGPVSTEKGVPGDGDALLIIPFDYYFVIVPQAILSPALPAGSVFISSAFA